MLYDQLIELASALEYLHSCGIVHGDVKGPNVLLSESYSVKLCDFGLARPFSVCTTSPLQGKGSTPWQAPELMIGEHKTAASDAYAFGMTMYEVSTAARRQPPLLTKI